MTQRDFTIVDSTLRDGSHAVSHQFTADQVRRVVAGLDKAQVSVLEVSHGDGLGGSSFNYGFSGTDEFELLDTAVEVATDARVAVLLLPGIGVADDLRRAVDHGAKVVRVATHCTEADVAVEHLQVAGEVGLEPLGFLMMAHMATPEMVVEQAAIMRDAGAKVVYVTDSAGALTMEAVRERVQAVRSVGLEAGFHGHNNLHLAVANSIVALQEGATWIDTCTRGLGAGAGNTATEALVAVCDKLGYETGIDTLALMDVAEEIVAPLMHREQIVDRAGLALGYAGVYSSFLLHANRAAERFDVEVKDILLELGRRGMVGGQEDMIIDVAAEMARSRVLAADLHEST